MFTIIITKKTKDGPHTDTTTTRLITDLLFSISTAMADADVVSVVIKK